MNSTRSIEDQKTETDHIETLGEAEDAPYVTDVDAERRLLRKVSLFMY
jgi:hypothetical protein